jgi:hypothetical protein
MAMQMPINAKVKSVFTIDHTIFSALEKAWLIHSSGKPRNPVTQNNNSKIERRLESNCSHFD